MTTQNNDSAAPPAAVIKVIAVVVVVLPLVIILFPLLAYLADETTVDPTDAFQQLTGWTLPPNASIVKKEYTHGGMQNDGDFKLVIRMSPQQLQGLVENDSSRWIDCPIDSAIDESAWDLPEHSGTRYYAKKTFDSDPDWHRGHIVIVNPETGFVWIYEWKS
ncbi:MAG: hypothetical protein RIK87_06235 [Fuerstiella sp.]